MRLVDVSRLFVTQLHAVKEPRESDDNVVKSLTWSHMKAK